MKHQDVETLRQASKVKFYLMEAKALIDTPEHWCQGADHIGAKHCSRGALSEIMGGSADLYERAYLALLVQVFNEGGGNHSVETYNDTHTHAEVMAWWDRAIVNA